MNEDILKGKWTQIRGDIKKTWGKLTDDDLTEIDGNRDKLVGRLQERYGYSRDQAQHEYDRFERALADRSTSERNTDFNR